MAQYKVLGSEQEFSISNFRLVPIRMQDRLDIMKWRNEQIYHLRQNKLLTETDQNWYFEQVVAKLFDEDQPNQILFSLLEEDKCIGYGGLVHINWVDRNAEISFIMNTELESDRFEEIWVEYLKLLDFVALDTLGLHKIYTYAFDLRPHIYPIFESSGYVKDAVLKEHCLFNGKFLDVVIHAKFK